MAAVTPVPRGHRIGAFEIETLLGAGGMGEVYRARDTRLGRAVAIKLLPSALANDAGRVRRLQREARVLASLNHPNIGTVYGLEPGDGVTALVMELVDGDDLSDRIATGPLPMTDALAIARQIAGALEAAHAHGVIHRDLKPANIKVRSDGTVKVLDFGLARTMPTTVADHDATVTLANEPGHVTGTPAYMSPEQARGERVGQQADIWAFGVVLYEMLTGKAPFAGPTTTETLARVLERQPDDGLLPGETPAAVRRLLRRCLEKDRPHRQNHIGDARIELEDAARSVLVATSGRPRGVTTLGRGRVLAVGAVALLAGLGGWWLAAHDDRQADAPVVRLTIPSMTPAASGPNGTRRLAISRDGSRIAYASANGLLVRRLGESEPVAIAAAGSNPFFSPDGQWLAFFAGESGLMKVPVSGGLPVVVLATTDRIGGGTWGADGTIVFAASEGLYRVSQGGGAATLLAKPDATRQERAFAWPQFMPDGHSVLFTILRQGPIDQAEVAWLDLRTGRRALVLTGGTAAQYTARGEVVYAAGSRLFVVPFDPASHAVRGEAVAAPDVVLANTTDNGAAEFAVADAGTLVYANTSLAAPLRTLLWVDRAGREEPLPLGPAAYAYARISPDGTRIALDIMGAERDIFIFNGGRGLTTRLTDGANEDALPLWSLDSRRVFFASNRLKPMDIYSQPADGSTGARLEFTAPGTQFPISFSPDGTHLIVQNDFNDLGIVNLARPDRLQPLLNTPASEGNGVVSPDGRWIAYESRESSDRFEVVVRSFPEVSGRREQVSIDGGRFPLWEKHGRELFYVDLNGMLMSAAVVLTPTLRLGKVTPLFRVAKPAEGNAGRSYDVSPVDGRFLVMKPAAAAGDTPIDIEVVLNWFTELRQHAAASRD